MDGQDMGGHDEDGQYESTCIRNWFRGFVCVVLTALLVLHVYGTLMPTDPLEADFSEIKYIVMQLTSGLTEVNRKHENLKSEMDRLTSALPAVASAAGHAKDAMQMHFQALELPENYDRQIEDFALETAGGRIVDTGDTIDHNITSALLQLFKIVDYALETAGGRIVDTGDTIDHIIYDTSASYLLHCLAAWFCRECINARAMIRPGTMPGECWAFKGQKGEATIRLLGTVFVTGVSLEHISPKIAPTREISMAPRLFQLEGLSRKFDPHPHDFGTFEYNKDGRPIQYFEVKYPASKGHYLVRVTFLTNWGNPVFTCVYRLRIHGKLVHGQLPYSPSDFSDELRIDNE